MIRPVPSRPHRYSTRYSPANPELHGLHPNPHHDPHPTATARRATAVPVIKEPQGAQARTTAVVVSSAD